MRPTGCRPWSAQVPLKASPQGDSTLMNDLLTNVIAGLVHLVGLLV
ncbi:hypothetical protein G3I31_03305 [Streptomyces sp. SID9913]|uniref:Uncharacterized protein n=2 Tax=unclassified Streptomyces TaxID=2593676 RepID=A0A6G3QZ74_9ACTN|nr:MULTISPECIES: hypothetical protein [unclassified Streptomyces]NEA88798.1 hypothetical protein [Streptomyces sp. SID14436]NEC26532.1 hypothetical protein [Streptomyces sp. SID8111]NEC83698.1 hypothetical protein [Streptomyces sp. SID7958]NED17193.1 hypothetical protein [Streptomyces sp. SID9913]